MNFSEIRRDFPIAQKYVYLDHAAGGPIPRPVLEAVQKFQKENAEGADFHWLNWMERRDRARETAARFIGADPAETAFISSTSHGMNLIAEVLADEGSAALNESEFPSSTVPWLWRGVKAEWGKEDDIQIPAHARTLVTSYVQYATGFRRDLKKLGQEKGGRYLVVNATQGCGVLPVNVREWNADFMCTNSYKWMMAGYGGGILYIRREHLEKFRPAGAGWRSMAGCDLMDNRNLKMKPAAERYEWGCPNFAAMFGFAAAADYFMQIGISNIENRVMELTGYLAAGLKKMNLDILSSMEPAHRSGIVVFKIKDPVKVWKELLEKNIYVSPRGGGIRVAPHFYNTEDEIGHFLKELAGLL